MGRIRCLLIARQRQCSVAMPILVGLLFSLNAFGQGGKASVSGVVTDASGASIAEATITATNVETGFSQTVKSNTSGTYSLLFLPVGEYKLNAQQPGFKTELRTGVTLTADQAATIDFQLTVGQVSEQVSVSADAQILETENASLGQVINERAIEELPLNGRNPASLVLLTPGTVNVLETGAGVKQSYTTFPTETGASSGGGRQGSTYYLLDGAINMDNYHLLAAPFPNPDATQEFRVIGNNFDARYGFAPGAVVSIVTKSGTNEWHGNAFEFLRNGVLNARDFFYASRDDLKRNQFGGSLGGPIIKNKLFIFGNYQGTTERRRVAGTTAFVPSDAMRQGDFSSLLTNRGIQLIDPTTQQPFANNYINPARFSPGALTILQSIPQTTDPLGQVTVTGFVNQQDYHEFTIRGDYNINERHQVSMRSFVNRFSQPPQSKSLLNSDRSWDSDWQNYAANYTWTISPSIVNNLVGAYTRLNSTSVSGLRDSAGKPICYSLFIEVADPPNSPCSIEELGVGSSFGFGQNFNGINRWTWNVAESINITKGKHLIVAGVDVLKQYWNLGTDWLALPIIDFDGSYTGHELSDFMLGYVSSFTQGGGEYQRLNATQIGAYVQDQIKVTPNLTVNLGLRWEPFLAPTPSAGRIAVWAPGQQSQRYPNAPNGIVYPGDPGIPSAGIPNSYKYFAPRIGVAWRPGFAKNTSIRAAFGIFTAPLDYSSWNHSADTSPFSPTFSLNHNDPIVGDILFDRPWANYAPTGFKSPFPPFPSPGTSPGSDATFTTPIAFQAGWNQDFRLGRNQTWNVSIERQFLNNWLARAAYVGSEAYHLVVPIERNPGIFSLDGGRRYSDFSSVLEMDSWGTSNYQSGQFTLERRFANGLQFTANYTLSKSLDTASLGSLAFTGSVLDPQNLRNNRGRSAFDRRHVFVANFVYQTPALAGHGAFARHVLGGWQVSGIFRAQSGGPLTIGSGRDNSLTHTGDVADLVEGQEIWTQRGSRQDWLGEYFNTSAFTVNAPGTKGNSGRNNLVTGPGLSSWDAGLSKSWAIRERYRLQFRWEAFNVFNHTSFADPNTNASSSNFGRILNVGSIPPRVMQGALKFSF